MSMLYSDDIMISMSLLYISLELKSEVCAKVFHWLSEKYITEGATEHLFHALEIKGGMSIDMTENYKQAPLLVHSGFKQRFGTRNYSKR